MLRFILFLGNCFSSFSKYNHFHHVCSALQQRKTLKLEFKDCYGTTLPLKDEALWKWSKQKSKKYMTKDWSTKVLKWRNIQLQLDNQQSSFSQPGIWRSVNVSWTLRSYMSRHVSLKWGHFYYLALRSTVTGEESMCYTPGGIDHCLPNASVSRGKLLLIYNLCETRGWRDLRLTPGVRRTQPVEFWVTCVFIFKPRCWRTCQEAALKTEACVPVTPILHKLDKNHLVKAKWIHLRVVKCMFNDYRRPTGSNHNGQKKKKCWVKQYVAC